VVFGHINQGKIDLSYAISRNLQEAKMDTSIVEKVIEQLKELPRELQWRVLEFTRALAISTPRGISGAQLLKFAGTIPLDDVKIMSEAIEQGCEQVDVDEW
jgi:hypothetical protein